VIGLALFAVGISLLIESDLGAAPWDVFHEGVAERLDVPIGRVIVATGVVLLLLWIPLRQRPGVGTVLNAIEIGVVADLVIPVLPDTDHLLGRGVMVAVGVVVVGLGSALYIGSGLGAGPRDGLMMGLQQRGLSIRVARTAIEVTVLALGLLLGGTAGIGTLAFALGIGPLVQVFLPHLALEPRRRRVAAAGTAGRRTARQYR